MLLVVHLMFSSNGQRSPRNKLELDTQGIASKLQHDLFCQNCVKNWNLSNLEFVHVKILTKVAIGIVYCGSSAA